MNVLFFSTTARSIAVHSTDDELFIRLIDRGREAAEYPASPSIRRLLGCVQ